METAYIYALEDPRTGMVRYIGKANNIAIRYKNHLNAAKDKNTHKKNWINQLKELGLVPTVYEIDEVPKEEWIYWERYWINQFKVWGFNLINKTDGGDGLTNGNQTSFKKGHIPRHARTAKIKILKGNKGKTEGSVRNQFKHGSKSWNTGITGIKLKPNKNVHQYDARTGVFIKTWETAKKASLELSINEDGIGQCARGKAKSAGGYLWSYIPLDKVEIKNNIKLKIKI